MVEFLEQRGFQIYLLEGQKCCCISLERLFQTFGISQEVVLFPYCCPTIDLCKAAFWPIECHNGLFFHAVVNYVYIQLTPLCPSRTFRH